MSIITTKFTQFLLNNLQTKLIKQCEFHTTNSLLTKKWKKDERGPTKFLSYNNQIFPPQVDPEEKPRPGYICHLLKNIKYSPEKMWYVASFVRGMSADEAIHQLEYVPKKGARYVQQAIREAQDLAVQQHNIEFKSNLWIAESNSGKAHVIKGVRRHARRRYGQVEYKYCHYFLRLEEGQPPKDFYNKSVTPEQQLEKWLDEMRKRKVYNSL